MKITDLEGVKEIVIQTAYGSFPVGIYEASNNDGILTLIIDIDRDAAAYTCTRPSLEADDRRKASAEFEAHADLDASREFGDENDADILG